MIADLQVTPDKAFFDGRKVEVRYTSDTPQEIRVIRRGNGGLTVRKYVRPAGQVRLRWSGLTGSGDDAPDGRYEIRVADRLAGRFDFRGHRYPVPGPHSDRGGIGVFHAPRSGGRIHEGYDVMAACGSKVVAARGGRVSKVVYDPVLYGRMVLIKGRKTRREYWYAHLRDAPRWKAGDRIRTGQRVGSVGDTGNAAGLGCMLHFEIRQNGEPIDPAPSLHAWDRDS